MATRIGDRSGRSIKYRPQIHEVVTFISVEREVDVPARQPMQLGSVVVRLNTLICMDDMHRNFF